MKVGIVGCGNIAYAYVKALELIDNITEIILYDTEISNAKKLKEASFLNIIIVESLKEFAQLCDAYIICTPNNFHLDVIKEISLFNNIPCICEKPLAVDLASAEQIINIAHSLSIISFNYRYNNIITEINLTKEKYNLGELNYFSIEFNKNSAFTRKNITWRDGIKQGKSSGALGDLSVHLLDLFSFISGEEINLSSLKIVKGTRVKDKIGGLVEVDDNGYILGSGTKGCLFKIKVSKSEDSNLGLHIHLIFKKGEILYSTINPEQIFINYFNETRKESINISNKKILESPEKELHYFYDSFIYMLKDFFAMLNKEQCSHKIPFLRNALTIQKIIEKF